VAGNTRFAGGRVAVAGSTVGVSVAGTVVGVGVGDAVAGIGLLEGVDVLVSEMGVVLLTLLAGVWLAAPGVCVGDALARGSGVAVKEISCTMAIPVPMDGAGITPDCARPVCLSSSTVSKSTRMVRVPSQPVIHLDWGKRLRSS
jgi:hypothetical protein